MTPLGLVILVTLSGLAASFLVSGKPSGFFEDITLGICGAALAEGLLLLLGMEGLSGMDSRSFALTIGLAALLLASVKYGARWLPRLFGRVRKPTSI